MAHFVGGSSSGAGGAPESNWLLILGKRLTEELHSYGLLVLPGCRLAKPWKLLRGHHPAPAGGGGGGQRRRRPASPSGDNPHPPPAAPAVALPEYELPPEQFVLCEDGDPDDSPGLLVALRASQATAAATAREEAEIAAAI
ncbi:hypothetical protein ZWY2020_044926 [Hordeum vulgare]|nr:hypothetical protein ZWY2020_044926 [Hordeum vulgare]